MKDLKAFAEMLFRLTSEKIRVLAQVLEEEYGIRAGIVPEDVPKKVSSARDCFDEEQEALRKRIVNRKSKIVSATKGKRKFSLRRKK